MARESRTRRARELALEGGSIRGGRGPLPTRPRVGRVMNAADLVADLHTAGSMATGQGDWEAAASFHQQALDVATEAGDPIWRRFAGTAVETVLHGPLRRGAEAGTAGRGAAPGPRAAADDPSQRVHELGRRVAARRSSPGEGDRRDVGRRREGSRESDRRGLRSLDAGADRRVGR